VQGKPIHLAGGEQERAGDVFVRIGLLYRRGAVSDKLAPLDFAIVSQALHQTRGRTITIITTRQPIWRLALGGVMRWLGSISLIMRIFSLSNYLKIERRHSRNPCGFVQKYQVRNLPGGGQTIPVNSKLSLFLSHYKCEKGCAWGG
jgi:hypothetical protein